MRIYQNIWRYSRYLPNRDNWFCSVCQIIWNIRLASKSNVWCFFRYILISADICLGPHSFHSVFWLSRYISWNGGKWYSFPPLEWLMCTVICKSGITVFSPTISCCRGYSDFLEEQITHHTYANLCLFPHHLYYQSGTFILFTPKNAVWIFYSSMLC